MVTQYCNPLCTMSEDPPENIYIIPSVHFPFIHPFIHQAVIPPVHFPSYIHPSIHMLGFHICTSASMICLHLYMCKTTML